MCRRVILYFLTPIQLIMQLSCFSVLNIWNAVSCIHVSDLWITIKLLSFSFFLSLSLTWICWCMQLGGCWMDSCNWNIHSFWDFSTSPQVCSIRSIQSYYQLSSMHLIFNLTLLITCSVTGDTCVAMNQWVQSPTVHTALDDILPCVDEATAHETLAKTKQVTSQLVDLINTVITNVSNINFAPNFAQLYFNQSGPLLPTLCNPFHPDLTDRACSPAEVDLTNATQVYYIFISILVMLIFTNSK